MNIILYVKNNPSNCGKKVLHVDTSFWNSLRLLMILKWLKLLVKQRTIQAKTDYAKLDSDEIALKDQDGLKKKRSKKC